ncbi:hypothetical protein NLJ89_g9128 [Agrocybe chaxingu]|uniref:DUF6534 domain-containing protein n=1 Tax=Agrocybe chaxingu TaxID=84603 RepID=A0A9W8K168_9AGAR|nr:hypothetical protein NLJ89_g9128 [Agrocybe chaxingu]
MEHNVDVQALFSPILLSVLISMVLQGILLSQIYNYFVKYKNDGPLNKYLVLLVFVVEALNTAFSMHMIYQPLVLQFGSPTAASKYPFGRGVDARSILRGLAYSALAPIHLDTSGDMHFGANVICWRDICNLPDQALLFICEQKADQRHERKTGVKSSDAVISRIIRLTVQTGLITSVAAVANVITLLALPAGNTLNFIFNITLMKFYGNFLLATLNNTNHRVGASIGGTAENVHFLPNDKVNYHTIDLPDAAHLQRPVNGKVTELSVSIETVTHRKVDPEA